MFPTLPHSLQPIVRFVRKERRPQNRRHAQQPRLFVLEDAAALLSTFTVTSSARQCDPESHTAAYAVDHAQSGDTIQLTAAIKNPIVLSLGELVVNQNVTIESVPARTPTISGDGIIAGVRDLRRRERHPGQREHHRRQRSGRQPERLRRRCLTPAGAAILSFGTLTIGSSRVVRQLRRVQWRRPSSTSAR